MPESGGANNRISTAPTAILRVNWREAGSMTGALRYEHGRRNWQSRQTIMNDCMHFESPLSVLLLVSWWRRFGRPLLISLLVLLVAGAIYVVVDEVQTSRHQARLISELARDLRFEVEPGASDTIRFPGLGPYDQRLGYYSLPNFVERLERQNYVVTAQARMSPRLVELSDRGLFNPYREKAPCRPRC